MKKQVPNFEDFLNNDKVNEGYLDHDPTDPETVELNWNKSKDEIKNLVGYKIKKENQRIKEAQDMIKNIKGLGNFGFNMKVQSKETNGILSFLRRNGKKVSNFSDPTDTFMRRHVYIYEYNKNYYGVITEGIHFDPIIFIKK